MRLPRRSALFVLCLVAGCATAPAPDDDPSKNPDRPFIKLAQRNLALVVYWRGPVAPESYVEQLERRLAKRLRTVYRTEVLVRREAKPFEQLSPDLFMELVDNEIDDVVIAEFETLEREDGPLGAKAYVVTMATQAIAERVTVERLASKRKGRPGAKQLADALVRKISRKWIDPGRDPRLDPLLAADTLADRNACDHAVRIYDRIFAQKGPSQITEMEGRIGSQRRWARCRRRIGIRDAIREDKVAVFRVDIDGSAVAKPIAAAFESALRKQKKFKRSLKRLTNKPVRIIVEASRVTMELRFHEDRYKRATAERERWVHEQPVVYIDPYLEAIEGLLALREAAVEEVPPYDRATLRSMQTSLHLVTLYGDYVGIDFADLDDRLLFTESLRVRTGSRPEIAVPSSEQRVTRTQRYVLGPPRDAAGEPTAYGLVFDFFRLGNTKKKTK